MSDAGGEQESFGQDYNALPRDSPEVVESIERDDLPATQDDTFDLPQMSGANGTGMSPAFSPRNDSPMRPPQPPFRAASVASTRAEDLNDQSVINRLLGINNDTTDKELTRRSSALRASATPASALRRATASPGFRRTTATPGPGRASATPGPRQLNLGNSMLNKKRGGKLDAQDKRDNALKMQKLMANKFKSTNDRQAFNMTSKSNSMEMRMSPFGFADALDAYESAQFSTSRPILKYKQMHGTLNRDEELQWIKMEARRNQGSDGRARSETPMDDEYEADPPAAVFAEIKKMYDRKKRAGTISVEDEIEYMKIEAKESARQRRQNASRADRGSTPSSAGGLFVGGDSQSRGGSTFGGGVPKRSKFRKVPAWEARKEAKRRAAAGVLPDRVNIKKKPTKGFAHDGYGGNIDFGDYFLKATVDEDRPGVVETYISHVAEEIARHVENHGTLPVFTGIPLKDRLKNLRKHWNTKTKEFCRRHGIDPPASRSDDDDKKFNRSKKPIYNNIRAGQLNVQQACKFAVEAEIEMCRWRAKYHLAIGNENAPTNLPDLTDLDGLKLPTSDEFDKAYKPKYTKIIELVGQMFAECQDRIKFNHDRLHGVFKNVELAEDDKDTTDDESEVETSPAPTPNPAAGAAEKEKQRAEREPTRGPESDGDESLFPDDVTTV